MPDAIRPTPAPTDDATCPLCGRANQCAVSAGLPPAQCWCIHTPIAPAALARLAPAERGTRCLCPACAADMIDASPQRKTAPCPPTTSK